MIWCTGYLKIVHIQTVTFISLREACDKITLEISRILIFSWFSRHRICYQFCRLQGSFISCIATEKSPMYLVAARDNYVLVFPFNLGTAVIP